MLIFEYACIRKDSRLITFAYARRFIKTRDARARIAYTKRKRKHLSVFPISGEKYRLSVTLKSVKMVVAIKRNESILILKQRNNLNLKAARLGN